VYGFAAVGRVAPGDGRPGDFVVVADHSIFINSMMLHPTDNRNRSFAFNCMRRLRGNAADPRNRVLFLEEGLINSKFDVPLDEKAFTPSPDKILRVADAIVQVAEGGVVRAERDPGLDRQFSDAMASIFHLGPGGVFWWGALLVTLIGLCVAAYRFGWAARDRPDLEGPLLATMVQQTAPTTTIQEQRRQEMLRSGNLWEAARNLAREALAAGGATGAAAPRVATVAGGGARRRLMEGRVRRLWQLAHGPAAKVTLVQWRRLIKEAEELKAALADGAVRFA
jgi:hypothetical protein